MISIPKRSSIVEQATQSIRDGIKARSWITYLPSERHLCSQLQISRPSLRQALFRLAKEGFIEVEHGRRTKILDLPAKRATANHAPTVIFVMMRRITRLASLWLVKECQTSLIEAGYTTEESVEPYIHSTQRLELLRKLIVQRVNAIWILVNADRDQQIVFEKAGVRSIILGCAHEGVELPGIDVDFHAIAIHAVQNLYRLGHRRLHSILLQQPMAGDLILEKSMETFCTSPGFSNLHYSFSRTDGTPQSICRILDRLFAQKTPPTALFVLYGIHALTVLTHLMGRGIAVPDQVSLVCRDDDEYLLHADPAIGAYRLDHTLHIRKLVRSIHLLTGNRRRRDRSLSFFMPEFDPRKTVATAPRP